MIGILGGMGPAAGVELARILTEETDARTDQEHLPFVLLSAPHIPDRSAYLLGQEHHNPANTISQLITKLEACSVTEVGVACNTCHAPAIFDLLVTRGRESGITFHHIIRSTAAEIASCNNIRRVGIMGTKGCLKLGLYQYELRRLGLEAIVPDESTLAPLIHKAIYDPSWGIKADPYNNTTRPFSILQRVAEQLAMHGAEIIVLGCTEIPLVIRDNTLGGVPVIDPLRALARSLIRAVDPQKLKLRTSSSLRAAVRESALRQDLGFVKIPSRNASEKSFNAQPQE